MFINTSDLVPFHSNPPQGIYYQQEPQLPHLQGQVVTRVSSLTRLFEKIPFLFIFTGNFTTAVLSSGNDDKQNLLPV